MKYIFSKINFLQIRLFCIFWLWCSSRIRIIIKLIFLLYKIMSPKAKCPYSKPDSSIRHVWYLRKWCYFITRDRRFMIFLLATKHLIQSRKIHRSKLRRTTSTQNLIKNAQNVVWYIWHWSAYTMIYVSVLIFLPER